MTAADTYDDWFDRGYLRGLDHGRFHEAPQIAAAIEATPAVDDVRFRGEHLTVHDVDGAVFAVLWEEWFGRDASTWVRHPSVAAARSWTHQVAAQWLRNETGYRSGAGTLQVWDGGSWAAERDLVHGRWAVAIGLQPGVTYASIATAGPVEGWAFIAAALDEAGFPAETWPAGMRRVRREDLPYMAPVTQAPPDPAALVPAEPHRPERRRGLATILRQLVTRLLASIRQTR
ncbi:hypothetical protein [Streptomyces sp. NPDC050164]|uniref:hypothetical protein n=1 Tax=Streptomyces sp. NPDC050164 TaxID=3365605 RepID=UPI0037AB41E9